MADGLMHPDSVFNHIFPDSPVKMMPLPQCLNLKIGELSTEKLRMLVTQFLTLLLLGMKVHCADGKALPTDVAELNELLDSISSKFNDDMFTPPESDESLRVALQLLCDYMVSEEGQLTTQMINLRVSQLVSLRNLQNGIENMMKVLGAP